MQLGKAPGAWQLRPLGECDELDAVLATDEAKGRTLQVGEEVAEPVERIVGEAWILRVGAQLAHVVLVRKLHLTPSIDHDAERQTEMQLQNLIGAGEPADPRRGRRNSCHFG